MNKFIAILALITLFGCADRPAPKFSKGEIVIAKISGQRGMVIYSGWTGSASGHVYAVRFSVTSERTNTSIFSPDGDIDKSPFATVSMREFELESAK